MNETCLIPNSPEPWHEVSSSLIGVAIAAGSEELDAAVNSAQGNVSEADAVGLEVLLSSGSVRVSSD